MKKEFEVIFFKKKDGTFPAEEFINSLDNKISTKIYRTLEMLEKNGPELREPYSKHLEEGIFEIRIRLATDLARILYFFYIGKKIVATHGFTKKTRKTPPDEIEKAKACRKEFLDKEARKNENP